MGIKFDILSDLYVLLEDSPFSQFFTSPAPIKKLHQELRLSHGVNLQLLPTDNRYEYIDALREGKAIFVVKTNADDHSAVAQQLISAMRALPQPQPTETGMVPKRSYNELQVLIKTLLKQSPDQNGSVVYKKVSDLVNRTQALLADVYPDTAAPAEYKISELLNQFLVTFLPQEYILIKRQAEEETYDAPILSIYDEPEERKFPQGAGRKVFGQSYIIWRFDQNGLIGTETKQTNPKTVFNDMFKGWSRGTRQIYIIENKEFLRTKKHPFEIMGKDFTKIFLLNQSNIAKFVQNVLSKTQHIVIDKIKGSVEPLRQQAIKDIEDISKGEDEFERNIGKSSIAEYRKILHIMKKGLSVVDPISLFNDFITKDHKLNLKDYSLLPTPSINAYGRGVDVYNITDPLAGGIQGKTSLSTKEQAKVNERGNEAILSAAKHNQWPERQSFNVLVRPKANRANITNISFNDLSDKPDANNYEIFDKKQKRWTSYDPEYVAQWPSTQGVQWAIGFKSTPPETVDSEYKYETNQYKDFERKFTSFVIRTWSKSQETRELESILEMF